MTEENQGGSQIEGEAQVNETGAEASQSLEQASVTEQSGAEVVSQAVTAEKPKVFTEAEVAEREARITSTLQTQTAEVQERLARLELQRQIDAIASAEQAAQGKDKQDVDNGIISEDEAVQRRNQRTQALRDQAQTAQLQQALREQTQQGEQLGRILMAHDLAKKYGVDPDKLLKDANIKTPMAMIQKATDLALADRDTKLRQLSSKSENFDKGQHAETTGAETYDESLKSRYPTMYPK